MRETDPAEEWEQIGLVVLRSLVSDRCSLMFHVSHQVWAELPERGISMDSEKREYGGCLLKLLRGRDRVEKILE